MAHVTVIMLQELRPICVALGGSCDNCDVSEADTAVDGVSYIQLACFRI